MAPDVETWRVTTQLLSEHGTAAAQVVARRADELREKGDEEGFRALMKIVGALAELLRGEPAENERIN